MDIAELIAGRIPTEEYPALREGPCGRCGATQPLFDVLKHTFTNLDDLSSSAICATCAPLFSGELLKTAFYITPSEIRKVTQGELLPILMGEITFPCALSFSASRKKHRLFRTRVSLSSQRLYVSLDAGTAVFELAAARRLLAALTHLYQKYPVAKDWLLTGVWPATTKVPLAEIQEIERRITRSPYRRGTPEFDLFIKILNKDGDT